MSKLALVMGTRPEIIKLSPLIRLIHRRNRDVIFSGQHYDYDLGLRFIDELGLKKPDFKIKLSHTHPARQIGEMIQKLAHIFLSTQPDMVVVQGDTNTVLASVMAATKCKIEVCHVEAGLRSFDWRMPEEHNRIVADHLSELLFAPTMMSKQNLINENVHGKIFIVGNTVLDALEYNIKLAHKRSRINTDGDFILLTLHRAENVDNKQILGDILKAIIQSDERTIFPVHPRTLRQIQKFGFNRKIKDAKNITMMDAVGYFEMLSLMQKCKFIISDSGGIQEEATSTKIRKKVLVVRKTTDRPEAVKAGFAEMVGTCTLSILDSIKRNCSFPEYPKSSGVYGDGRASQKILKLINNWA